MFVVTYRKIFYAISTVLMVASIISLCVWGLNFSIDFTGGSLIEVTYQDRPNVNLVNANLEGLNLDGYSVRPTGTNGYIIRTETLTEDQHVALVKALTVDNQTPAVDHFDSIGPILGKELQNKAILSIILVIIAIVIFITFAFRKVSKPVASWKYGLVAVIALIHDVIVPTGVFSILGHFQGFQIDTLFITAILVVLGFSVHDTIVVFDRTRENLKLNAGSNKETFAEIVGKSISQTFTRSINTSLTVVLSLLVLFFIGSEATRDFSLVLLVGIIAGTYSSVFLGSPLLVTLQKWQEKKGK